MRRCTGRLCCLVMVAFWMVGTPALADPAAADGPKEAKAAKAATAPPKTEKETASQPSPHTVKKGLLKIELELDGVFEAAKTADVVLRPEEWAILKIQSAVPHGKRVKHGDQLLTLETEKIDQAIADLRAQQKTADVAVKLAAEQLAALEKLTPLELAEVQRSQRNADEDLAYFFKVERPFDAKMAELSLKIFKQYLEYQEEELRQLEKMYKADDLTEETEEIILKRARNAVELGKFFVESAEIRRDRAIQTDLPRKEEDVKEANQRMTVRLSQAKTIIPLAIEKLRLDLAKLKQDAARGEEKLKKLLADREAMVVKAPMDGVVYYGKCERGKFSTGSAGGDLHRGGTISANEVFMTVVQPRPMFVRVAVPEKQITDVRPGVKGTASPTGYPDLRLSASVGSVAEVPLSSGAFDTRISVALGEKAAALMPGMTCKVKLTPYLDKEAITVPPKAVSTDELNEQKHFVWLVAKGGKAKKHYVVVGRRTEKQVEILKGLSAGNKILAEPPKEKP